MTRTKWQTIRDSLAYDVIRTPPGAWPETQEAWRALVNHVGSEDTAHEAVTRMTKKFPDDVHPDRR